MKFNEKEILSDALINLGRMYEMSKRFLLDDNDELRRLNLSIDILKRLVVNEISKENSHE